VGHLGIPRFFECSYTGMVLEDLGLVLRAKVLELVLELGQKRALLAPDRTRAAEPGAAVSCCLPLDLLERGVSLPLLLRYGRC